MKVRTALGATSIFLAALLTSGQLVAATPLEDKLVEASRIQAEIEKNGMKLSALAEKLNMARIRLEESTREARIAQANLDAAEAESASLRDAVDGRAIELLHRYAQGQTTLEPEFDLLDLQSSAQRSKYAQLSGDRDREAFNKLAYVRDNLASKRKALAALERERREQAATIEITMKELKAANAAQVKRLEAIEKDIRDLMIKEQGRLIDEARNSTRGGRGVVGDAVPNPKPVNDTARKAIAYAYAQLGKPYVWAAEGPDAFDCSGLTMRAYGAAGVKMRHWSGFQYADFPRVSLQALLPGDLIFWGPNGSEHVGIYIGEGLMINAPHTGDVVKVAPVWANPMGATRPWL